MIWLSRFLYSKWSGYMAIAGFAALLGMSFMIYRYGWNQCQDAVILKQAETRDETQRETSRIEKEIRNLQDDELINRGCALGIVYERDKCE